MNEVSSLVGSSLTMLADDTELYRTIRDTGDELILQDDLRSLTNGRKSVCLGLMRTSVW